MTFTRRTMLLVGLMAVATVALPTFVGLLGMAVVVAAAAADAWAVRRPPSIARVAPAFLARGVPARLAITAVGATRVRQPVASGDLRVEPAEAESPLEAVVVAGRRGHHELAPVATLRRGPLGLGAWHHRVGPTAAITVYPDLPAAARLAMEVRLGRFRDEGRRTRGPLGLGTDLESIREYLPDDDIRQVNWRATARTGHPMSNTYRIDQDRDVICLLDCGRLMASPVRREDGGVLTRLDAAIDAVAAIAAVAEEVGDRIGLVAYADRVLCELAPRRNGRPAVVDAVHDLEPIGTDSDHEAAIGLVAGRKRAFVVVLTDLLDPGAARPLLAAVGPLARRHAVAVAGVRDPAVDAELARPSDDPPGLARTVVAARVALARESVAADLTHRGVTVVDATVDELSTACVAAYLRAKRRGRL